MNVHFVCRGNVYRSRLAEAYAKSLQLPGMVFSSSGVEADKYYPLEKYAINYIEPWTVQAIKVVGLDMDKLSPARTQTTNELLQGKDMIIAMKQDIYDTLMIKYDFNRSVCVVWDIDDVNYVFNIDINECIVTFKKIEQNVDELIKRHFNIKNYIF